MRTFTLAALLLSTPAAASTLFVVDYYGTLSSIDLATLQGHQIGPVGVGYDWGGLSWDMTTQQMYMAAGRGNPALYTLNLRTGAASFIGNHNVADLFSIAIHPTTGRLYGLQADGFYGLYELNKATGAATLVGNPNLDFGGADFLSNGRILANQSFTDNLYAVNPATGAATLLGSAGIGGVQDNGLAVDLDNDFAYLVDHSGTVWEMDPANNYQARVLLTGLGLLNGAAVVPDGLPTPPRFSLNFGGACPGAATVQVTGATPGGQVALAWGTGAGAFAIPGGPCAGTVVPLQNPRLATTRAANNAGEVTMSPNFGAGVCGRPVVAVDLSSCTVSNVASP